MARYDIYCGLDDDLLLDLQANTLKDLNTRFVVPLRLHALVENPVRRLNPTLTINDAAYVMLTQFAASVPTRELGRPIATAIGDDDAIGSAIDLLLFGF